MTPQDIRDKRLEKAVFGGYDCPTTDNFLDFVASELAAALKENSILRSKMKILVEKIEEYRATEDAMKLALLSAQKLGAQIQNEAKESGDRILAEAREKAKAVTEELRRNMRDEEFRLAEARNSSARFIESMRVICTKQLDFLEALGETDIANTGPLARTDADPESDPDRLRSVFGQDENRDDAADTSELSAEYAADDEDPLIEFSSVAAGAPDDENPTKFYSFNLEPEKASASARTQFSFETLTFDELEESV